MATAREYMQADMEHLFAAEGEEVRDAVINGTSYRAIVQDLDIGSGDFEGLAQGQRRVFLLKGSLTPVPRPDSSLEMDGEQWLVDSTDPTGLLDIITLVRNR